MPVAFPLAAADWFGRLPIAAMTLDPIENVVADLNGRGEPLTEDVAPLLWRGTVTLGRMTQAEANHAGVMMDLLRPSGRLFRAFDLRRPWPANDPNGVILGSSLPIINTLVAGNRELRLSGLPAGYILRRGDMLGWTTGGRAALHRVVDEVVTANASGLTPVFEVSTRIEGPPAIGTSVSLIRPSIPCMLVRDTISPGETRQRITEGFSFSFVQTRQVIA